MCNSRPFLHIPLIDYFACWKQKTRRPKRHYKQLLTNSSRCRQSQRTVARFVAKVDKPLSILDTLSISVANCVSELRMATARLQIHPSQARHHVFARFALGVAQGLLNRPVNLHCGHGITYVLLQHPIIC